MKLHRLEVEGFGPFLKRQIIDFDAFDDDGIFLIAGRTGAGKSSILDGVSFALYGGVPRYDGGAKRLRSDHCAPGDRSEVRLEFTVGERRWRVTRSPEYEREKKNGTGTTTEEHRAVVEELVDGDWIGRAGKPREAAALLGEILGLNREQFQQVILLAQNRFAQFLLASGGDRQALLRTLFGTRTYQDYERTLDARRKDVDAAVADSVHTIEIVLDEAERIVTAQQLGGDEQVGPDVPDRIAALDRALERGRYRAEVLTAAQSDAIAAREAAFAAHERVKTVHERARERDAARTALAGLHARTADVDADRRTLQDARRAEPLRVSLAGAARAEEAAEHARAAAVTARTAWERAGGDPDIDAERLGARIDELTGRLAVWQDALAHETALASLREQQAAAQRAAADAQAQVAELEAQRAALPARLDELDAALRTQATLAAKADDMRIAVEQARTRRDAAEDVRVRAAALHEADKGKLARQEEATAAALAADTLLRRRIEERAGELAAALDDGEPCPVCGSTAHPQPAPRADRPVSDDELAAAEKDRDAAQQRAREAADAAAAALAAHADAIARAGGLDPDDARRAYEESAQRLASAEEAVRERDRLQTERDGIVDTQARIAADLETARAQATAAERDRVTLDERVTSAQTVVAAARGAFDTVAARIDDAHTRRGAALALRTAMEAERVAADAARAAAADRDRRVAASDFSDAAAALAAARDETEQARLDESVRAHDAAVAEQKGRLVQLELQLAGADDPLPDLDASAAALADARESAAAAADAATAMAHAVDALARSSERARSDHAQVAELEARQRLIGGVADAVAGRNERKMDLETFVLAAELEQIVIAANVRLDAMSAGRYRLAHTDALAARNAASGLGLEVVDAYTGRARPAQSLSGGETFLASLALALGLAQVVTDRAGGIQLDTLFIDEGFGSLDPETLESAMRTLDELRAGGRTVGVISHVETMQEQIPAQLIVEAAAHGPSTVRQFALDPV